MKEKMKRYIDLIPQYDLKKWFELLETKKCEVKNILSSLEEEKIELNQVAQMTEIFEGIKADLTTEEIMVYAKSRINVEYWPKIRRAITRGIPIERIKPILVDFTEFKLAKLEKEHREEQYEKEKKHFLDVLYS